MPKYKKGDIVYVVNAKKVTVTILRISEVHEKYVDGKLVSFYYFFYNKNPNFRKNDDDISATPDEAKKLIMEKIKFIDETKSKKIVEE
jgi:hypothetical protein